MLFVWKKWVLHQKRTHGCFFGVLFQLYVFFFTGAKHPGNAAKTHMRFYHVFAMKQNESKSVVVHWQ